MTLTSKIKNTLPQSRSPWLSALLRFVRNPLGIIPALMLLVIIVLCLLAPVIAPYDYLALDLKNVAAPPGGDHLLGTDTLGRDTFSRLLVGGRTTIGITFCALGISAVLGAVFGVAAGYLGGRADVFIMRITEALASVPTVLLAVVVETALGWGEGNYMYAIGLAFAPPVVRITRACVMNIMTSEYIEAARALGVGGFGIIFRHVLHNIASPLLVHLSSTAADCLLMCTILGYIGLGITVPEPEWGLMVNMGYSYLRTAAHVGLIPCAVVVICALCLNLVGNCIRDALDDKGGR